MSARGSARFTTDGVVATIVCAVVAAVAFWAFPLLLTRSGLVAQAAFRGLWAGIAGGLAGARLKAWRAVAATAVAAALVAVALGLGLHALSLQGAVLAVAVAGLAAAGTHALNARLGERVAVAVALVVVLLGLAWTIGIVPGPGPSSATLYKRFLPNVAKEPAAEQYKFDGSIYRKTLFLMKRGEPYYPAFSQAIVEDKRYATPPGQVFNYREPWASRFVVLLPGNPGIDDWLVFMALVVIGVLSSYALVAQFASPGAAILAPMLVSTYFAFSATTKWFPLVELWGGALAILAILAFSRERWWWAVAIVTVCVALRELMVYLIPVGWILGIVNPRRRSLVLPLVALGVLPAFVLVYHALSAPGVLSGSRAATTWVHAGIVPLLGALRFSTDDFAWGRYAVRAAPVLALIGALLTPEAWRKALFASMVVVAVVSLSLFSNGPYGIYWGGIAVPLLLALSPLSLQRFLPRTTRA